MMKKDGFTIIELLVTLIVLAIVASISIPVFSRWLPDYRLRNAAREVYSNMQLTKMNSVKHNAEWAIIFNPAVNRYVVFSDAVDGDWTTTGDNIIFRTVNLSDYEGIRDGHGNATTNATQTGGPFPGDNVSYTTPDNVVRFSSRGMAIDLGYVYLSNSKGSSYAVGTPSLAGAIVLKKWNGSAWE